VAESPRYIPALRFDWLTPLFDPILRVTPHERRLKSAIAAGLADLRGGGRVLDVGCGTGTLCLMIKSERPDLEVVGVDGDAAILRRAAEKAGRAGADVTFEQGLAGELAYPDGSFDAAVSSLVYHHLDRPTKEAATRDVARVLRPGGRFLLGDLGKPSDPLMAAAVILVRVLDGMDVTRDNVAGRLPEILEAGGLVSVTEDLRMRTPLGTISVWSGRRPAA
jgi:SAM-dependent methyltransferase